MVNGAARGGYLGIVFGIYVWADVLLCVLAFEGPHERCEPGLKLIKRAVQR